MIANYEYNKHQQQQQQEHQKQQKRQLNWQPRVACGTKLLLIIFMLCGVDCLTLPVAQLHSFGHGSHCALWLQKLATNASHLKSAHISAALWLNCVIIQAQCLLRGPPVEVASRSASHKLV